MTGRPSRKEIAGVLLVCAVLLVALVRADRAGYERHQERARAALAQQGDVRPAHPPATGDRTVALGWLLLVAGAGGAMCVSGAVLLSRRSA